MKKKESKKSLKNKKALLAEVSRWCRTQLLLNSWTVHLRYPDADDKDTENRSTYADIDVDSKYYEAYINIYPSLMEQSPWIVFSTILHELSHIVTEIQSSISHKPLDNEFVSKDQVETANEQETSMVQTICESIMSCGRETQEEYEDLLKKLSKVFK